MSASKPRTPVLAEQRFAQRRQEFDGLDLAARFDLIHRTNLWGAEQSTSGLGSELAATATLRHELSLILRDLDVRALLDLPCGDFTWMSHTDLAGITYLGADIVPTIIAANLATHAISGWVDFRHLDLVADPLPTVDLILCRDCLVHLSFEHIHRAIGNMKRSRSQWLLTTTFIDVTDNRDVEDGDWRTLNLQIAPFHFPEPRAIIIEGCTEANGDYADKALGLWRLAEL